ncbi:hypothetical protein AAV35_004395 [Salimicrobium jeotgali]|uniref:DNA modification methylase n=1 Tax=Salimicrobium jeotgali TaxID=1230341 RepID=K2H620_9BACI|nr:N-6 DNA methylase [Salimicrobium jeotgali]AKG04098.1 hypothetical protein AAV35_004395 [Salimicrobium jeotgali]EKE31225.1 DNA modification methylase [Salimicrobium jeotgali]MBM7697214.1 adenine-specific DNA-methyltransferase [Salimicrobium jeotgali]
MITEHIHNQTKKYTKKTTKDARKKIGQFFTPTPVANYMANLVTVNHQEIKVLDPGAGTGTLTASFCGSCEWEKL